MTTKNPVLTWHGHSCFSLESGSWTLVIDPYDPAMIGYPPLTVKAHAMLASHGHGDHNHQDAVAFLAAPADLLTKVAPDEAWPQAEHHFQVKAIASFHDPEQGKLRGSNLIHVVHTAGVTVAHLGDLGHLLDSKQAAAVGAVDYLLLPVGGYYTIDAAAAQKTVQQLKPKNIIPMHYQIGHGDLPISTVEPFLELVAADYPIQRLAGNQLELDPAGKKSCFVFSFEP